MLLKDLYVHQLQEFSYAYEEVDSTLFNLVYDDLIETYFADVSVEADKTITSLNDVTTYGFDLVRGTKTLDLIKRGFPQRQFVFRNNLSIWVGKVAYIYLSQTPPTGSYVHWDTFFNLASSLNSLQALEDVVRKHKVVVTTYCSLLHIKVDLVNVTRISEEEYIKFIKEEINQVVELQEELDI
ncbi:hypothetical protein K1719_012221 [Acacia pycnantha]|nr:hypothetical protein K1719_012221 [Acacia pycnantha]